MTDESSPRGRSGARLVHLPVHRDPRGGLSFAQHPEQIPFVPQRHFLLFGLEGGVPRGAHAHRALEQFVICVHGSCRVELESGRGRDEVHLADAWTALHVPPMVWTTITPTSADVVVSVLASAPYDAGDYIRDYDEFVRLVRGG